MRDTLPTFGLVDLPLFLGLRQDPVLVSKVPGVALRRVKPKK